MTDETTDETTIDGVHKTICPWCKTPAEYASPVASQGSEVPRPLPSDGDVSVCVACMWPSIFDENAPGGLRRPTDETLGVFLEDPMIKKLLALMGKPLRALH